jgi:hypothetical protein
MFLVALFLETIIVVAMHKIAYEQLKTILRKTS